MKKWILLTAVLFLSCSSDNPVTASSFDLNDSASKAEAVIEIDLKALGFTAAPEYKEIAYNTEPEVINDNTIKLATKPYKTYIISITKP